MTPILLYKTSYAKPYLAETIAMNLFTYKNWKKIPNENYDSVKNTSAWMKPIIRTCFIFTGL